MQDEKPETPPVKIIPPAYAEGAAKQKTARAKRKTEAGRMTDIRPKIEDFPALCATHSQLINLRLAEVLTASEYQAIIMRLETHRQYLMRTMQ